MRTIVTLVLLATSLVALGLPATAQRDLAFASRNYPSATSVRDLALGDVDGDGFIDAVSVTTSTFVYLSRGRAGGAFEPGTTSFATGSSSQAIAAEFGDVDGDGNLDLLVLREGIAAISVLLGDGAGGFGPPQSVPSGVIFATDFVVDDFDGDGDADVAITAPFQSGVSVLTNNAGTFGAPQLINDGQARGIDAGDLNGDGRLDLVVAGGGGATDVRVYLGGAAGFTLAGTFAAGDLCAHVAIADFDGDAVLDVACALDGIGSVSLLKGDGLGGLGAPVLTPVGGVPVRLSAGDVDADGVADLAAALSNGPPYRGVSLLRGSTAGLRAPEALEYGARAGTCLLRDLDGDGGADLAYGHQFGDGFGVAVGRVPGFFDVPRTFPLAAGGSGDRAQAMVPADMNADGIVDVVVGSDTAAQGGLVEVWLGDGLGGFASAGITQSGGALGDLDVGDLNGDGRPDAFTVGSFSNTATILIGDGAGGLTLGATLPVGGATAVALGDLDGDGDLDAACGQSPSGMLTIVFGNGQGGASLGPSFTLAFASPRDIELVDLDGDGDLDIVVPGQNRGYVLLNFGGGTFGAPVSESGLAYMEDAAAGDVTGDGLVDIVAVDALALQILPGLGTGSFGSTVAISMPVFGHKARTVVLDDVDGDGLLDAVCGHGPSAIVFFADGLGSFEAPRLFGAGDDTTVGRLESAHVDGDGRPDLISVGGARHVLAVSSNRVVQTGPFTYCVAKVNSLGCKPVMSSSGWPRIGAAAGFEVRCANVLNAKPGYLFYGTTGMHALPFLGGVLCVNPPLRRSPVRNAGGSPPPTKDCSGVFAIDFDAFAAGALGGNPHPSLSVPGTDVWCQWWGRDQGFPAPQNVTLSNGLQFTRRP